jgi:Tol biopolymer transport system component/DNA-binding winged helix-turn-helix (wHTH) protein
MAEPAINPGGLNRGLVRFGIFELDVERRELRKSGARVKLHDQPFQVLALLVERPGEVVTREELQQRLWPSDTFVDFDLSLNSAVKKLRQALGDDSENPRFVETLYRRGYRFVAPVTMPGPQVFPAKVSGETQIPSAVALNPDSATLQAGTSAKATSSGTRLLRRWWVWAALGFAAFGILAAYWITWQPMPRVIGYTQITRNGGIHSPMGYMVTDGQRIYFQGMDSGRFVVGEVAVSGGDTAIAASVFPNTFLGDVAPDGSAVLISSLEGTDVKAGPVWLLPLPAGSPRQLSVVAHALAWTPDGRRLIYGSGSDVYESAADGSDSKVLSHLSSRFFDIRVSPDGRKIRGTLSDLKTGFSTIWEMDRDGGNLHEILPGWSQEPHECCGHWTPDGRYFIFASFTDGRTNLWALQEDRYWFQRRAKPVQLTNGPLDFSMPVPSQDGRRIFAFGEQPRTEVLRYDGERFVPYFRSESAADLSFSADGQNVAYVSIPDQALWVSRSDGSQRIQLTNSGRMQAELPRWSPDGKQIAFMARTLKTDWRAYLVSASGGNLRELIPGAAAGFDPGWSPDGKSIVIAGNDLGPTSSRIEIVDIAIQKPIPIPGGENAFSPRWSPDGRYIAGISIDSQKLMLFDRENQTWSELVKMGIGFPSWSHDSKYLYFDSILTEDPAVYRVRIADHKLERVISLKGIHRYWGIVGEWSGLAPDDSILLTRDTSNSEVYALDWER